MTFKHTTLVLIPWSKTDPNEHVSSKYFSYQYQEWPSNQYQEWPSNNFMIKLSFPAFISEVDTKYKCFEYFRFPRILLRTAKHTSLLLVLWSKTDPNEYFTSKYFSGSQLYFSWKPPCTTISSIIMLVTGGVTGVNLFN